MRNLKEDKQWAEAVTAHYYGDLSEMDVIALHALNRAITAESKLELAAKALHDIRLMLDMDHSSYQKYLIWKIAFDFLEVNKGTKP